MLWLMPRCVCCCCCCACCFATTASLPSPQNNGGSSPGSLSPHHRQGNAAPYGDDDGTDETGISFGLLMEAIDQEHELHLLDEQQQQQQQQGFSAAAAPVEPSKAVLDGAAVIEAVETAMATTARTAEDTEDALSRLCSRVRNNQVR